uniref:Secreted protein n=1 Tax=Coturnix japonica TaxID=93934 RepID=A0A8C2TGM6_COTJA
IPSPTSVLTVLVSTALPVLLKLVLSLTTASDGRLGTIAFRSTVDSCPKLRTIIKTLSNPSNSLTYTKTSLSLQMEHIHPRCMGSSLLRSRVSSLYRFRVELDWVI